MEFVMLALACTCLMIVTLAGTMLKVRSFGLLMAANFAITFAVLWGTSSYMSFADSQFEAFRTSFWISAVTSGVAMLVSFLDRRYLEPKLRQARGAA